MTLKVLVLFYLFLFWNGSTKYIAHSVAGRKHHDKWNEAFAKSSNMCIVYFSSRLCRPFNQHHLLATRDLWAFYFLCTPPWYHATPDKRLSGRYQFKPADFTVLWTRRTTAELSWLVYSNIIGTVNAAVLLASTCFHIDYPDVVFWKVRINTTVCALSIPNLGGSPASFLSTADRRSGTEAY